jgi:hypothetical protein
MIKWMNRFGYTILCFQISNVIFWNRAFYSNLETNLLFYMNLLHHWQCIEYGIELELKIQSGMEKNEYINKNITCASTVKKSLTVYKLQIS